MIKPTPTGRATIRDPLGQDTGHLLVDTNAPVPRIYNLPEEPQAQPKSETPGTEGTAPKP